MLPADRVVDALRRTGDLWEPVPGAIGLRGDLLALSRAIERRIAEIARREAPDEWQPPPVIGFDTLARADYFASFPQWLTGVSHLSGDRSVLERVATAEDPARAASTALERATTALPPALCYHTYDRLAGSVIEGSTRMTAQGTCWRHEGARIAALERGWSFTMREIVGVGEDEAVEAFRQRGIVAARRLAEELGIDTRVEVATDPFFAPTAAGKAALQRIKALKYELLTPIASDRELAIASFNHHDTFFGNAYDIRLPDGRPAASSCVAYGLERWTLAFLVSHGTESAGWSHFVEDSDAQRSELILGSTVP